MYITESVYAWWKTENVDVKLEEDNEAFLGIDWQTVGTILIITAAAMSAGSAVFTRALKEVDYVIIMTYYGMIGLVASVCILTVDYFFIN